MLYFFLTNRDGGDLSILLSSQISDQATGIITWHRTHQDWSAGLHLQPKECQQQVYSDNWLSFPFETFTKYYWSIPTSFSTTLARSRGCSMMLMKDSPRTLATKMCDIASRRSGRKAWINNSWCTAWPMGADHIKAKHSYTDKRIIIHTTLHTHLLTGLLFFWPQIRYSQLRSVALYPHEELLEKQSKLLICLYITTKLMSGYAHLISLNFVHQVAECWQTTESDHCLALLSAQTFHLR